MDFPQDFEKDGFTYKFRLDAEGYIHVKITYPDGSESDYPNDGVCEKCGKTKTRPFGIVRWNRPHKFLAVGKQENEVVFKSISRKQLCFGCFQEIYQKGKELWK